jgi:hypothetical protein
MLSGCTAQDEGTVDNVLPPLIVAVACWVGAVATGLLGWAKSGKQFDGRSFLTSVLSGFVAAIAFAMTFNYSGQSLTIFDVFIAIAAGAGVDNAVNRISGSIVQAIKSSGTSPPSSTDPIT